ncbi:MAG: lipopolysaccharide biosynthesis protein [Acidimicrobiia bacterium]|nr:lipopolysaccharide biosynthesis protein [Acidimicrobiia bacterium]
MATLDTRSDLRPTADGDRVRQAARGSAFNLVGAVTAAVVSFFTVGLITNTYGQSRAGVFFAATALFTLAANGARLGAESSLTFFVSRLRAADRRGEVAAVTATALRATAAVALLFAVVGFLGADSIAAALAEEEDNARSLAAMIRVLALVAPVFSVSQAMFGASRGFGTMRPSVVAGQLVRPIVQLALVALVVVMAADVAALAWAWAGAAVVSLAVITVWLRNRLNRIDAPAGTFRSSDYWRFAAPRALTDVISSALERLDLLLVAYVLGEAQAGVYGAANRLIVAGQLMMFATSQSMAPHLSAAFAQDDNEEAEHVLHTVSAWNVTLLWPVFLTMAFGAETILRLFGDDFTDGTRLVQIFSVALVIIIGLGVGDTLLLMTGRSLASLVNHLLALVTMVGLSLVLLPRVGVVGAAWAWAASRILIRVLAVITVWRTNRVHGLGRSVMVAGLIAFLAYVPTGWLIHRGIDNGVLALGVHVAVGAVIQLVISLRFRELLELDQLLTIARLSGPGPDGSTRASRTAGR